MEGDGVRKEEFKKKKTFLCRSMIDERVVLVVWQGVRLAEALKQTQHITFQFETLSIQQHNTHPSHETKELESYTFSSELKVYET